MSGDSPQACRRGTCPGSDPLTVSDISGTYSDMHKRDHLYFMNPGPGGPGFGGPPDFGGGPFFKMRVPGPGGH